MKVILLKDVAKIGRRHDVVDVPDGYAINRLIPQGMAKAGTASNIKAISALKSKVAASNDDVQAVFDEAAQKASALVLTVVVATNEKGHMFETIKPGAIAEAYKARDINLDANQVTLPKPIKEVGEHEIALRHGTTAVKAKILLESKK